MEKCAIGIDIGGTKTEAAIISDSGRLIDHLRIKTSNDGPDKVIQDIIDIVETLFAKHAIPIACIGIGVAGQVEKHTGKVIYAPNLKWENVNLRERIATEFGLEVAVCNDVRAAAWGEWLIGAGAECDDLVCIFVGTGVGGAIVCHGQMVEGHSNTAGEVGHIIAKVDGPLCQCGNNGCLEAIVGGWAIKRDAQQAVRDDMVSGKTLLDLANGEISGITAETVVTAALKADALANCLIDNVVKVISASITSIVNTLGPKKIILGGGIIEGMPQLISRIEKDVKTYALHAATANIVITSPKLRHNAVSAGAALFALRTF